MTARDQRFLQVCPVFFAAAMCVFAWPGTAAPEQSVTMPPEFDGWSLSFEESDITLYSEGLFTTRYGLDWSPDAEEFEWLDSNSVTFDFVQLGVGLTFFEDAIDTFFIAETDLDGVALLEGWVKWNVLPNVFSVQAGRLRVPFSKDYHRKNRSLRFLDRPLSEGVFQLHNDFGFAMNGSYRGIELGSETFAVAMPIQFHTGVFAGTKRTLESTSLVSPLEELSSNNVFLQEDLPLPPNPYLVTRIVVGLFPLFSLMSDAGLTRDNTFLEVGASMRQWLEQNTQLPRQSYGADLTLNLGNFTMIAEGLAELNVEGTSSTDSAINHAASKYGVWVETRYRLFDRFEPACRVVGHLAPDETKPETHLHSHKIIGGLAVYFMDDLLRWQVDAGAHQDEWDFARTTYFGQTAISARF